MGRRVAVIGLDGVSCRLVRELVARGTLPFLAELLPRGFVCDMTSSLPPVASVAWTSCVTGVNPAKHGIFGFMERRRGSYGIYFPSAAQVRAPAVWDELGRHGLHTVAVNIPQTYPAREIRGIMISGFVAVELEKAVYPPGLAQALHRINYPFDDDSPHTSTGPRQFFDRLYSALRTRRETCATFLKSAPWDLFFGVFSGPGRMLHSFWEACESPDSPWHAAAMEYFRQLDAAVAELVGLIGEEADLIIMAQHGYGRLEKELYLNTWLQQQGLLALKGDPPYSFEHIDGPATKAFALEPGRIYVNLKGTMPGGCVEPGADYEQLVKELNAMFLSAADPQTGQPLISRVYRKEEIYAGPLLDKAPDLVLQGAPGYGLTATPGALDMTGPGRFPGMPTGGDAFFYMRGLKGLQSKPRIVDIAPTVLRLLNLPIPEDMDGRPLV